MIHPIIRTIINCRPGGLLVLLLAMVATMTCHAGVSVTPPADPSNTNAMEQYRVQAFYEAQKSEQARARVAQERYDKMLSKRAHLLQAMSEQLAAREEIVDIPDEPAAGTLDSTPQSVSWMGTTLGAAVIGFGFLGFRYYLHRQELKNAAGLKY